MFAISGRWTVNRTQGEIDKRIGQIQCPFERRLFHSMH